MRLSILLFAAAAAAPARPAGQMPPPVPISTIDVPQDKGGQEVLVLKREFPVGASSGWHVHPGVEIAYVLSGEMALDRAGQPRLRLRAGDSFTALRGVAHNGTNVGKVPARLLITYVVDKGAPVRAAVPAPSQ
jgi:quercetin dioxygenase-like cupin family protein